MDIGICSGSSRACDDGMSSFFHAMRATLSWVSSSSLEISSCNISKGVERGSLDSGSVNSIVTWEVYVVLMVQRFSSWQLLVTLFF